VLRSRLIEEELAMPGGAASRPFTSVGHRFAARVYCPTCDVFQPMHVNAVRPALYCGKDTIFFQCTRCGNETTERVASEEGPLEVSEPQQLSLE
jgi:hypothetical protein